MAATEPWRDLQGYWHMPPFPWREWLVWGGCQLTMLTIAFVGFGLFWLAGRLLSVIEC